MANQNIDSFLNYWDDVVSAWLTCAKGSRTEGSPFKDVGHLSEREKNALNNQKEIIAAINESVGKGHPFFRIHPSHMPEPYWGNPKQCSFVMLNYNPAGGANVSCFTSIECVDRHNDHSLTALAARHQYSGLALDFPLLADSPKVCEQDVAWLKEYPGYNWWQKKSEWIEHLNTALGKPTDMKPFAMELCGWHSEKWSSNVQWMQKGSIKETISQRVILPMLEALKENSTLAVCIGATFRLETLQHYFSLMGDDCSIYDCTRDFCEVRIFNGLSQQSPVSDIKNEGNRIVVTANGRKRYYRIYQVEYNAQSFYILNTWTRGSNKQPSCHFWEFENRLIEALGL